MAASLIRENGGVLEHPKGSLLWAAAGLPRVGARDLWGGFTLDVCQWWWGHRALKPTWLYVCGMDPADVPPLPPVPAGSPSHVIQQVGRKGQPGYKPECSKREREATPPRLAEWLVELASRCRPPKQPEGL